MSADNWSQCPNCLIKFKQYKAARIIQSQADLEESYRRAPRDEYETLRQAFSGIEDEEFDQDNTVREDYEFYLEPKTGAFSATYNCKCSVCDFQYTFTHAENIHLPDERKP